MAKEVSKVLTSSNRTAKSVRERARRLGLIAKEEPDDEVEFVRDISIEEITKYTHSKI